MMSAARCTSRRDWAIGLPCSSVITTAISSTRWRMMATALRMISARLAGDVRRQTAKPLLGRGDGGGEIGRGGVRHGADAGLVGRIDDGLRRGGKSTRR